jgi:hypothetical protein
MQQIGPFKADANRDKITLIRDDSRLVIAPNDAHSLAKLVNLAMSYCSGKVLPPQLKWGNFEFRFSEDGTHTLAKADAKDGLFVTQNDGDELIQLLSASLSSHVDSVRLTAGPRRGARPGVPDPVVVGRE